MQILVQLKNKYQQFKQLELKYYSCWVVRKVYTKIYKIDTNQINFLFFFKGNSGTAPSSESTWVNLFGDWDLFYPKLINLCKEWNVNGIDLDCELPDQWQSGTSNYDNITKLVSSLYNDMGSSFKIVFAPVASAIFQNSPNGGLSGFNYNTLMTSQYGKYVSWLNLQFYNNWGSLDAPNEYEEAVKRGYNSQQLVAGMEKCSDANNLVNDTIKKLSSIYGNNFGGVFVWEGNNAEVLNWSKTMQNNINK